MCCQHPGLAERGVQIKAAVDDDKRVQEQVLVQIVHGLTIDKMPSARDIRRIPARSCRHQHSKGNSSRFGGAVSMAKAGGGCRSGLIFLRRCAEVHPGTSQRDAPAQVSRTTSTQRQISRGLLGIAFSPLS